MMTDISAKATRANLAGVVILAGGNSRRMGSPKAQLMLPSNERLLDYHVRHAVKLQVPIMIADNQRGFTVAAELLASAAKSPVVHISDYQPTASNTSQHSDTGGALVAIESALQFLTQANSVADMSNLSDISNVHDIKKDTDSTLLADHSAAWLLVISCDSLITAPELWQKLKPYIASAANKDIATQQADVKHDIQTKAQIDHKSVICLTDASYLYPLLGIYNLTIEPELQAYINSGQRQVIKFMAPLTQAIPFTKQWQYLTNFNTPADFKRACSALYD
jgi:molybdopterin-guanine dinucleotide biosynthesis protein A